MPRYRRIALTPQRSRQAAALGLVVGTGVAIGTWLVARVLLSRDALERLPPAGRGRALPAASETPDGPAETTPEPT